MTACLCCNKTHTECKFGRHNQLDGYPCERHDDNYEELYLTDEEEVMIDWKSVWESMLRYSEMDAEELNELSHKKVQELQQLRKEIREV
mgnify:CR=1 FL=1